LATQNGDKYINKIVDASDVFSCKREWQPSDFTVSNGIVQGDYIHIPQMIMYPEF
jgi:hypothetical protein